jgi:hypothetical protein
MLKLKIYLSLCCFLASIFSFQDLRAGILHAVFVTDSINDISLITKPDLLKWQTEIQIIGKYAKLPVKEKVFTGSQFNKAQVSSYIQKLNLKSDDSFVFYFSGHGYRTVDQKSPFPVLTFTLYEKGIELEWIANVIRSKKPHFALVMADCCNMYLERGFSHPTKKIQVNLHPLPPNYPAYEQLFAKAKGCIVVSSCSAGEFSYGSHLGGLYTQCFFASLNRELSETKPSWKNLLRRSNGYISSIQKPICMVLPFDKGKNKK